MKQSESQMYPGEAISYCIFLIIKQQKFEKGKKVFPFFFCCFPTTLRLNKFSKDRYFSFFIFILRNVLAYDGVISDLNLILSPLRVLSTFIVRLCKYLKQWFAGVPFGEVQKKVKQKIALIRTQITVIIIKILF